MSGTDKCGAATRCQASSPCSFAMRSLELTSNDTMLPGSGKSEGESVSLGFYEAQDLEAVLEHLQD
eukprot:2413674-Rhodomonas_salina.1